MNFKKLAVAAVFSLSLGIVETAHADYIDSLSETFASGATFNGTLTIDSNFVATAVSGTLSGYSLGTAGYVGGSVSESISWVYDPTYDYATAPLASNWLLDASSAAFNATVNNSLLFTIDFTNTSAPAFTSGAYDNGINTLSSNADFLVSGTVTAVPVPAAVWLFVGGFAGMGWFGRRKSAVA